LDSKGQPNNCVEGEPTDRRPQTAKPQESQSQSAAAEKTLRATEERYKALFDRTLYCVFVHDLEGRFLDANACALKLLGYTKDDIPSLSLSSLLDEDQLHKALKAMEETKQTGSQSTPTEYKLKRKDGGFVWVETEAALIYREGKPFAIQGIARDITVNKQAEETLRETSRKIERLHDVAHRLAACKTEDEVYQQTVNLAEEILSLSLCTLCIREGNTLKVKANSSLLPSGTSRDMSLDEETLSTKTYDTGKTFVFGSLDEAPVAEFSGVAVNSGICVPMNNIGVFQVVSSERNAFTKDDARLLELLVRHTAGAVKRLRLQEKILEQANQDALTGVYNRHYFMQMITRELARARRYQHSVGFLMIDINRFKEINDLFGHQVGDRVLQEIGTLLLNNIRESDIVVRYGGDEFLIVLPETGEKAENLLHRINQAATAWDDQQSLTDFPIRLAIGIGYWHPEEGKSLETVLNQADRQMYADKQAATGKDQLELGLQE